MLKLIIQGEELWDDEAELFTYGESTTLEFEHSLVSLSKWEAKLHKRFLTKDKKSEIEMYEYIRAMLLTPDVSDEVLSRLTVEQCNELNDYLNDPMTGSVVQELRSSGGNSSEQISAELIYFWMSQYRIALECERWHLNRLFTLIKIHHAKNEPPRKMNSQSRTQQMAEINAKRRAANNSRG